MADDAGDPADDREWRFSVDEVGPDAQDGSGETSDADGDRDGDEEEPEHGVAGSLTGQGEVEPESPALENAVFVAVGAYVAVLGVMALFVDPMGFGLQDVALVTLAMLVGTLAMFAFFGVFNPDT